MKKVFLYKLVILFAWLPLIFDAQAQYTSTKTIQKSFNMTDAGEVMIKNKYGHIEFYGWEKDSVRIKVVIETQSKSDELINRINPTFDFSKEFLEVESVIEAKKQGYFNRLFREINPIEFDKTEVDIHFEVFLPAGVHIKVENKYGDVSINDCKGRLRAQVEHGDLRIEGALSYVDVLIRFGLLRAYNLPRGEIDLKNGRLDISNAQQIELISEGSEIEIDDIQTLRLTSSKDESILISSISTITGSVRFSDLTIEQISGFADLDLHQSELKINHLLKGTTQLQLTQKDTEIEIASGTTGCQIEAYLEGGLLRLPTQVTGLDVNVLDEKDEIREVKASLGQAPFTKINITGKKGYMLIKT
jgi:hypothetical protein